MKGIVFSLDLVLGISLMVLLLASNYYLFSPQPFYEETGMDQKSALARDFLEALATMRVNETTQSPTLNQLKGGGLTDDEMELSVLDFILTYWAYSNREGDYTKRDYAENITKELINATRCLERYNFSLSIGSDPVVGDYAGTQNSVVVSSLIENTYSSNSRHGYMARAYLNGIKTERSRYLYFGGFVGQGNISALLELPEYESVTGAELNVFSGANLSLYINSNFSGYFSINESAPNFTANIVSSGINISNFREGNNTLGILFNSTDYRYSYIGGGFLRVDYTTSAFYDEKPGLVEEYRFPGIEGLINVYDGVYLQGNVTEIHLHYYNEIPGSEVYLNFANATLYNSNASGESLIELNESNISEGLAGAGLNVQGLTGSTVPLRVGIRSLNYTRGQGFGDAVLITDVSGSMSTCDVYSNNSCDCDAPPPCYRNRINVAKDSDREFVSGMLGLNGNRVGLVSFDDALSGSISLTGDNQTLQSEIDTYVSGGGTCICCGIEKSTELLSQKYLSVDALPSGSIWKYTTSYPLLAPPEMDGRNWTDKDYNDSAWAEGPAALGFFNISWDYRRQLNLSNAAGALYSYPVRISINLSGDYSDGRVKQYCGDARFTYYNSTSGTETELPYLIESCNLSGSDNATFWVSVPYMAASSETTLYLYYGNPSASPGNNLSICPAGVQGGRCLLFYGGFEDSSAVGPTGFNTSVWSVDYGSDGDECRVHTDSADVRTGSWGGEMEEGDEGEVAISTRDGLLNLSGCTNCRLDFWIKLTTNWEDADRIYVDVYDGSWHYGELNLNGETYDTGNWHQFTLNLSEYDTSSPVRVRFDNEASDDNEEAHLDDVMIYHYALSEPYLGSIGSQEGTTAVLSSNVSTVLANNGGDYYFRKKFFIESTEMLINSSLYVFSDDAAEVYLNGNLIDNDTSEHNASYWNRVMPFDKSLFRLGWNVVSARVKNDDSSAALFDLRLETVVGRKRAMLVMSDGGANYECTPWQYSTYQGPVDAIQYSCNARDDNITVYSVAFGSDADTLTLKKIACWNCSANNWLPGENETNCSKYFQSNNEEELMEIYKRIADDIVNMSAQRQAVYVQGDWGFRNVLYNDSRMSINLTEESVFGEGEFLLTFEKNCTGGYCILNKSADVSLIDARVTSYSGDYWADLIQVSNSSGHVSTIYNLSTYGDFEVLGDPYSIKLPSDFFSDGANNITLYHGIENGNPQNQSKAYRVIYSIKVPGSVGYGGDEFVFNTSQEARDNATERLIQHIESKTGEEISSYEISTSLTIEGIRELSQIALVRFIMW
ncbi:MAG: DUF2341 domain-containing protein [Candidatus Aenigmarchaeota archaeon]|nr:DUF2341 domain-containing protein [Candidatus Aenigmarchaeota archaeon]